MLIDKFGRSIDYLRLGITDRCNLRCRYCMPEEGINFAGREQLLSYEEIERLSAIFSDLGISKIRLTGGEPFVRRDLMLLIEKIRPLFDSFHITTNATLIGPHLKALRNLNIEALNISLDSLHKNKYFEISGRDVFEKVYRNIFLALDLGFHVKLNFVVMKNINDNEINDFVELTKELPLSVRFIEAMPFNAFDGNKDHFMPYDRILEIINLKYELIANSSSSPSSSIGFTIPGHVGNVAIIPAFSRTLCGTCNRIRLTATGSLLNCLYARSGFDLRSLLRSGVPDQTIKEEITAFTLKKKKNGFEAEKERSNHDVFESMTTIGG